ncbi:MAG: tetratricopeptide repeat protein [Ignavibacteriae bacterium]|nr:tetratricopeptide repeat protein [Ignavibacteriota bacterium]
MNQSNKKSPESAPADSKKKNLFTAITLLFPLLVFGIVEGGLRLFGYGHDLSLFTSEEFNGKKYYILREQASSRYFSKVDFNPNIAPDYFLADKPDTTFRIFCLGGSTTAGFPFKFCGAFPAYLRERLHIMFPERSIEVINLGMTATNSFTVLDIAEDLFAYKPDLLIVYDGHNEFYGALGIASNESLGSSRALTRLYLKMIHLRTFQLMRNLYVWIAGLFHDAPAIPESGTMMERLARGQYIRHRSDEYNKALESFKQNLEDLRELCRKHNVPVLVGSQVSNVRDQQPFISGESPWLTAQQRDEFHSALQKGIDAFNAKRFADAANRFLSAIALDSLRADAHYHLAQAYDSLGRKNDALREYTNARDYDMLRFRTSSDFNATMKSVADEKTMFFVDLERKFKANAPDSLIGSGLITEHLHPNSRGQFLIAKEYQWMMHWNKIMATQEQWNERTIGYDDKLWEERTVTDLDERAAQMRVDMLTAGWPFRNDERSITLPAKTDTLGQIAFAWVRGTVTYERAHVEAAQYYERRRDYNNVAREYRTLTKLLPLNVSPYLFLAKAYLRLEKNEDAARVLLRSLDVEKTWYAYKTLGLLALDAPVAISFFQEALNISQSFEEKIESNYLLGTAYARDGKRDQATRHLEDALAINPDFKPASDLLNALSAR